MDGYYSYVSKTYLNYVFSKENEALYTVAIPKLFLDTCYFFGNQYSFWKYVAFHVFYADNAFLFGMEAEAFQEESV